MDVSVSVYLERWSVGRRARRRT